MTDFKAKMHQIRFGWGSAADPAAWGSLQRCPDPLAGFGGRLTADGGAGLEKRRDRGRRGRRKWLGGKGRAPSYC